MAWPTLSIRPKEEKKIPLDNAIKHESEDNHIRRRPRSSRVRHQWEVTYEYMKSVDAEALIAHYESVYTYTSFIWYERDGTSREVVFEEPIKYSRVMPGLYQVDTIKLTEV
jgi:hypothetical protein